MFSAQSLGQISNIIDHLKFRLNNGTDEIKEYCIQLRIQVMLETELAIQKIQNRSEELIKIIDQYEQNSIINFETEKAKNSNSNEFIEELELLPKASTECSGNSEYQDNEIDQNKSLHHTLNEKFRKENNSIENLIFDRKLMFYPNKLVNPSKIDENLLGNFKFRKNKYADSIDIEKFEIFQLKNLIPDLDEYLDTPFFRVDSFDDGKLALIYTKDLDTIRVLIIDQNRLILKSFEFDSKWEFLFDFKITNKNYIIFHYLDRKNRELVVIIDSNLQILKSFPIRSSNSIVHVVHDSDNDSDSDMSIDDYCISRIRDPHTIEIADQFIYCLSYYGTITTFDFELTLLRKIQIKQTENKKDDYYNKMIYKFNKFYCLSYSNIDIIDENTGVILTSIDTDCRSIKVDWQGNILAMFLHIPELVVYSSDGSFIKRIRIVNNPCKSIWLNDSWIDKDGQFFHVDFGSSILYTEYKRDSLFYQ